MPTDRQIDCRLSLEGIKLSRQEHKLFTLLCEHFPNIVSHTDIYVNLLGDYPTLATAKQTAAVYIMQLRKKIGKERIVAVRGEGYYLK